MKMTADDVVQLGREVTSQLSSVLDHAAQFAHGVAGFQSELGEARQRTRDELDRLSAAINGWGNHVRDADNHIAQLRDRLRTASAEADQRLTSLEQKVTADYRAAQTMIHDLSAAGQSFQKNVMDDSRHLDLELQKARGQISTQEGRLDQQYAQTERQLVEMTHSFEQARGQLDGFLEQLRATMEQKRDDLKQHADRALVQRGAELFQQHGQILAGLASQDVATQVHALQNSARQAIESQAMGLVNQVLNAVIQDIEKVTQDILGTTQKGQHLRELMGPVLDALKGFVHELEGFSNHNANAADAVFPGWRGYVPHI